MKYLSAGRANDSRCGRIRGFVRWSFPAAPVCPNIVCSGFTGVAIGAFSGNLYSVEDIPAAMHEAPQSSKVFSSSCGENICAERNFTLWWEFWLYVFIRHSQALISQCSYKFNHQWSFIVNVFPDRQSQSMISNIWRQWFLEMKN